MARAMWKGVIRFGDVKVPVKLFAAAEDRTVHFRLLHRKDQAPVRQAMINPLTDEVVPPERIRRAFVTAERDLVILEDSDLESLDPEPSRDIEVLRFLPVRTIDHRWYQRPYFLGPDAGGEPAYAALSEALAATEREGLARWVMRKKEYLGALRLQGGYPMLMSLRYADEIVAAEELAAPTGPELAGKEVQMASQLVEMLTGEFEPTAYRDEYRDRVRELVETKARGGRLAPKAAPRKRREEDLTRALEASLKQERKRA